METVPTNENNVATSQAAPKPPKGEYQGWLLSDSFLKRSFAIWGHHFVANLIISIVMFFLTMILFMIIGFSLFSMFAPRMNLPADNSESLRQFEDMMESLGGMEQTLE